MIFLQPLGSGLYLLSRLFRRRKNRRRLVRLNTGIDVGGGKRGLRVTGRGLSASGERTKRRRNTHGKLAYMQDVPPNAIYKC